MSSWLRNRPLAIAAVLALIVGCFLSVLVNLYAQFGGDGPNFWGAVGLATELPGVVIGENLFGVRSPMVKVLGGICGVIECFVAFSVGLLVLGKLTKDHGEPLSSPRGQ